MQNPGEKPPDRASAIYGDPSIDGVPVESGKGHPHTGTELGGQGQPPRSPDYEDSAESETQGQPEKLLDPSGYPSDPEYPGQLPQRSEQPPQSGQLPQRSEHTLQSGQLPQRSEHTLQAGHLPQRSD